LIIPEELVFCLNQHVSSWSIINYRVLDDDVLIEEAGLMVSKYCQGCELFQLCHYYCN
jgi:hypothetical protein